MKSVPVLHTDRCSLTAITSEDIPVLREILDDQETQQFLPELYGIVKTKEGMEQFFASFDNYLHDGTGCLWGIRMGNESLIGFVAIMDIPVAPVLFFASHPIHRRQGYMKEALRTVMQYKASFSWAHLLTTEVYDDNVVSISLLQDVGFIITRRDENKVHLMNKEVL